MKKRFIKLLLMIGILFIGISDVYADDSITFKIDGASVKVGDVFDANISVSGADEVNTLTDYDLNVTFDTNVLELVEGSTNITASGASITSDGILATLKLRANAAKDSTNLELKGAAKINGDEPAKTFKVNYNSGTVSIRNVGTDNTLKSLKIPNTILSPDFNKDIHDYKATVTDLTSIEVKAEPNDSNASVWTNGVDGNLQKGENDVVIVCKSESGVENYYSIKVTLNLTPTPEELIEQDTTLKSLSIKGQKIEFTPTEKKYYINVDYDTTKIDITALPTTPEAEVVITGNTKLVIGKNTVKINVTSKDKTKTDTYQIIVTRENEEKEIVKTCPDETSKKEWIIFTASLLLTFTLGIVLGYFLCRKEVLNKIFKKKQKEEAPVAIETLSDTIDLSDTVKKVSTEAPKENTKK